MSNRLYPCSMNDPLGEGTHSGLLGHGTLPWPSVIAERHFPTSMSISGFYATDELSAAHFMVATLSDPDNGLDAQEHEQMALHLIYLLSKVKAAGYVTAREVKELHQKAQSIPVIGPLLFSLSSIPGEAAALVGMLHAFNKGTRLAELLDLPSDARKKLTNWAITRGTPGSISAKRAFKQRIKLVRLGGQLYFEVPANSRAKLYKISERMRANHILLPVHQAAQSLRRRVPITSNAYSARGVGRIVAGTTAGAILAVGPQAIIDATESGNMDEFLHRSAYSQPTNLASFAIGAIVATAVSSAVVAIVVALGVGYIVQLFLSYEEWELNRKFGNLLTGTTP
ncbi:hypothetical protein GIV40_10770 [Pseudomonas poae]|uniref:hypothetical protein n=1 Tax=Pseudomonas poae TaxID=200451 RepID=UPI001F31CD34|nr:hypothetical protein [Pseudomonas poae]MCF5777568.1 hypothetical protein [Pseudomonas poae]